LWKPFGFGINATAEGKPRDIGPKASSPFPIHSQSWVCLLAKLWSPTKIDDKSFSRDVLQSIAKVSRKRTCSGKRKLGAQKWLTRDCASITGVQPIANQMVDPWSLENVTKLLQLSSLKQHFQRPQRQGKASGDEQIANQRNSNFGLTGSRVGAS